jgi:hypothetical protein
MGPWGFVLGAYVLVLTVLLGYAFGVERRIRALERGREAAPARPRS